jgi:predicted ATPase/DNA-binding CsgD family transcriptional regulator
MPAEVDSFVGRRAELTQARSMLESHRLVTLTGPGGIGKTRLALRVATQVRRAFPDGTYFVDLSRLQNPLLLGDTVLQVLDLVDQSPRPAAQVLAERLPGSRLLLVLDNCEHLVDACGALAHGLLQAAPDLRVLVTSREPLRLTGESVLTIAPVSADDAVSLFAERARAMQAGFTVTAGNRDTVAELCRRLDHLPLAIELAAARLRVLNVTQILDRLGDGFRLLTAPARTEGRHRSLDAAVAWSADTCTARERALWARTSVFAGDFDLDGAEQVCANGTMPGDEVLDLLTGLVDKSVLAARRHGPVMRYAWLDSLRAYGSRLLAEGGETQQLRQRHRDWCLTLANPLSGATEELKAFGPAMQRMRVEQANVRAALDFCLTAPGEAGAGVDLAGRLAMHWLSSATLGEGRHWLQRALAADREQSPQRIRALWACGWIAVEQGDLTGAEELLAQARELATRLADEPGLAWAIALSGYAALHAGELDRARTLLTDGLARQRSLGNVHGMISVMSGLAQATSYLGDPVSEAVSDQAIALSREHQLDGTVIAGLRNLGLEFLRQGRHERATEVLREALRLGLQSRQRYGVANCLDLLAWAAQTEGRSSDAARLLGAGRAAYRAIGATMPRPQRDRDERYAEQIRRALGEQRFAAAYQHGEQLPQQEAIRYALGEDSPAAPPQAPDSHPLTRRERQVAALVARGLSAKQIAAELIISTRTAESHVDHILTKLGFTARTQIAAWVARRPATDR